MAGNPNLTPQDFLNNMNQILGSNTGPKLVPNNPNTATTNVPDGLFGGAPSPSSGGSFWGDFGKGMFGTGQSMLSGLDKTLGIMGNVFNTTPTIWNDLQVGAKNALDDVANGKAPSLSGEFGPAWNDLKNIWSNPTDANAGGQVLQQSANNAYGPTVGKYMGPAQQYVFPFVDPIANPLIGKAASLAGKGLMEGIGRIPGVEDWANSYLTRNNLGNAPSVYRQAAEDSIARDAQGNQLALPAPQYPWSGPMSEGPLGGYTPKVDNIARGLNGEQLGIPSSTSSLARTMPGLDDAEAQMINQWAGLDNGFVPPSPLPSPTTRRVLQGPKTAEDIQKTANWTSTPPMQNGRKLAQWIADTTSQLGFRPEEGWNYESLKIMPYKTLQDWAQQLIPDAQKLEAQNLAKTGFGADLNTLLSPESTLAGKTPDTLITKDQLDKILSTAPNTKELGFNLQGEPFNAANLPSLVEGEGVRGANTVKPSGAYPELGTDFNLRGESFNASNLPALIEGEGVRGGSTEFGIPHAPEEEINNILAQKNTNPAFNALAGMTPGDKLSAALGNVLKTTVGNRVNRALFRAGIGSGINLLPENIRNAFLNNRAALSNNNDLLNNHFLDLTKQWTNDGVTLADLRKMRNDFERGKPVDEKMQPILDTLTKANNEGAAGVESGLNAEKTHKLVPDGMQQLDNYLHLSLDPSGGSIMDKVKNIFAQSPEANPLANEGFKGDKANNITSHYAKKREFATAANAEAAGYKVRDPIASTLDRLRESNRDISNTKLYQELFDLAKKDPSVMSLDKQRGFNQFQSAVRNNPFHGMYLNPQMSRLLNEVERVPTSAKAGFMGSFLRGWDGMTNLYRATNLYNPMIHNHNTFGNALVAFGLDPKNYADAEAVLGSKLGKSLGGETSPEMQKSLAWAEKTGALGSDMHPDTLKEISKILKGKGLKGKLGDKYQSFQQKGLWDREKALRLGVFHQAFQDALSKGLKEADAASVARDVTNEHMVDYSTNNLSPLEKEFFSRVDPFYKWHKGNYPLQLKKSFTDPGAMLRQVKANNLFNGLNTALSGHPMAQNLGGDKEQHTNLEIPMGNGQVMSIDRYMPWDETRKMLGESLPSFLYNRLNPLLREGADQLANKQYYPSSALAPEGKAHLSQYPITLDTDNFGTAAGLRAHHAASAIAPNWLKNLEDVLKPNGNSAGFDLAKMGLGTLGTFPKQNPVSPTSLHRSQAAEDRYLKDQKRQAKTRDKRGN